MAKGAMHKILCIRLADPLNQALLDLVKTYGTKTRSGMVRKMIMEAVGQGPVLHGDDLDSFRDGVRQLAAIGRNINQIARAVNAGQAQGCPWNPGLMDEVVRQVADHQKVVADIVMRSRGRWVPHTKRQADHG